MQRGVDQRARRYLIATFWETALGFWRSGSTAWLLTIAILTITLVNLFVQYRINVWNRHFFDALESKAPGEVWKQTLIFLPLMIFNVGLAVAAIYARMKTQQTWRRWLNARVLDRWITNGRYYQLSFLSGDHANPEYRVADDLRVAVDAPVDFAIGLLNAVLSAVTFIGVLWFIGGSLQIPGTSLSIPGFLVVAAFVYAIVASGSMLAIGTSFVRVSESKNQAEAEYRYGLTRLRENGESIALLGGESEERVGLDKAFWQVLRRWRQYTLQFLRTTVVSQTSQTLVPVVPLILCAPKYLASEMSLGQVMQAASAFVTVQIAFNWLVDNYPRLADWAASARRVASLLVSLERLERCDLEEGPRHIIVGESEGSALELRNLSVTLDDGSVVVNEAVVEIDRGERILVEGESGTGKSTLVRAISGLWPWGSGEIRIQRGARIFLMPQRPYVPLGTLRRATTYPASPDEIEEDVVHKALEQVGLGHFAARLDQDSHWENTLSGGEKQRLAFARLLILRPDIVIMDEATSALDPSGQEHLMNRVIEELPQATVISVSHRPELERFHDRKILLEYHADGARLVRDENLAWPRRPSARVLSRLLDQDREVA
jgi:vitamin B12/bleomycin/antimicrobial peptide transport system ATP-binding/permease protein